MENQLDSTNMNALDDTDNTGIKFLFLNKLALILAINVYQRIQFVYGL